MTKDRSRAIARSKWFLPSFSVALGLIILGASWLGGLAWAFQGSPNATGERPATLIILLTIYVPALGVVAWRNIKRRRPVT